MKARNIESVLKESISAEPSAKVDAAIIAAIRLEAERKRRWHRFVPPMSIAAAFAVLLVGGWFWRADTLNDRRLSEEGEIVLDILGFASADEFYADAEL
jgi:type VI protein secretion system component VasF